MREQDAVAVFILVADLFVFAFAALVHLPVLTQAQDRLPRKLRDLPDAFDWRRPQGRRGALEGLVAWTAFSQFVPVALLVAYGPESLVGGAAAIELALAAGWTAWLLYAMRQHDPRHRSGGRA